MTKSETKRQRTQERSHGSKLGHFSRACDIITFSFVWYFLRDVLDEQLLKSPLLMPFNRLTNKK
jgi:hypothetical protein